MAIPLRPDCDASQVLAEVRRSKTACRRSDCLPWERFTTTQAAPKRPGSEA